MSIGFLSTTKRLFLSARTLTDRIFAVLVHSAGAASRETVINSSQSSRLERSRRGTRLSEPMRSLFKQRGDPKSGAIDDARQCDSRNARRIFRPGVQK